MLITEETGHIGTPYSLYNFSENTKLCPSKNFLTKIILSFSICYGKYWASLVAQLVENLPAMQETPVRFLGQEDSLEKG